MHITTWWGWLIIIGGGTTLVLLIWFVASILHAIYHFLDGW